MREKNNTTQIKKANNTSSEEDFSYETTFEMEEESEGDQGQWLTHLFTRNGNLSFACRGFLAYLFSHKPGYKINLKSIQNNVFNIPYKREKGRDYIRRLAKEAEKNGYLSKLYYNLNGLRRFSYKVHKKPFIKEMFARDGITGAGNPVPLLRISNSTDKKNNTKRERASEEVVAEKRTTPPSSAIIIFKDEKREIKIEEDDFKSLLNSIGKVRLDETIESIKNWLDEDQKRRISSKDILKKIKCWDERFQRTKNVLKKRKEIEDIEDKKKNKEKSEKTFIENSAYMESLMKNPEMKKLFKLEKEYTVLVKSKMFYNFYDQGFRMSIEKALGELEIKLE